MILWLLLACGEGFGVSRAERALREGDLPKAEAGFRSVLDHNPDQVDALVGIGWIYHLQGDPERAREYFKRAVRVAPQDWRGHRGLGSVALYEGNTALARESFLQALGLAPEEPRVLNGLGLVELAEDKVDAALPWFERAAAADPARGEYSYNLADTQRRLGRHPEALATIERGLGAEIEEQRFRAQLLELRALVLVESTSGRVDPARCAETAPPVLAWLDQADKALDQAEAVGVELKSLPASRRRVHRRRSAVTETCPQGEGDGK